MANRIRYHGLHLPSESREAECGGEDFIQTWRQLCARMLLTYSRLQSVEEAYSEHEEIFELINNQDLEKRLLSLERNITISVDQPDPPATATKNKSAAASSLGHFAPATVTDLM